MKKILVYYGYSQKNAGDMAICFGLLDLLEELDDCEITLVSRYAEKDKLFLESKEIIQKYHPHVIVKPGYISFNRDGGVFSKIKSYFSGFFISSFPSFSKRLKSDIENSDLILFNGGNYLRSNSFADVTRLKALMFPIKYAKKHNKRVICMPQSTAKAKNSSALKRLKRVCDLFDHIFVRDPISYKYLIDNNVCNASRLDYSCDLAFFSKPLFDKQQSKFSVQDGNKKVAFNVRMTGIGDIGSINDAKIELINKVYNQIVSERPNYFFGLICQTEKDYKVMDDMYRSFLEKGIKNISFYKSNDAYELKDIYSKFDLLISMRLHASILALSVDTPVVGFAFDEWGFKNKGILNQFGFDNYVTPESIVKASDELLNSNRPNNSNLINEKKKILLERINNELLN